MPTYAILMKYTDQGIKNAKGSPERLAAGAKAIEALGGKVVGYWGAMGEYDIVAIGEMPSDEAAATFAMGLACQGNVRTTTMKLFTPGEFQKICALLP